MAAEFKFNKEALASLLNLMPAKYKLEDWSERGTMKKVFELVDKVINILMASFLLLMGIFIFGNVLLRYCFNSGWTWAEELSRFLFVWVTFIGAIRAMKENKHLGFSSLIRRMPLTIQKLFLVISNVMLMYVLYLLFMGSWDMTILGLSNVAAATNIPMAFMFGVGLITFSCMAVIVISNTYKALFVPGAVAELIDLQESEEEIQLTEMTKGVEQK